MERDLGGEREAWFRRGVLGLRLGLGFGCGDRVVESSSVCVRGLT